MDAAVPAAVDRSPTGDRRRDFDAFARRERGPLVAFGWSLTGDGAAAEDMAQEALAAAWSRWDDIGGYDRPGAWARRVVANQAAGRGRRSGREQRAYIRWLGRRPPEVEMEPADHRFWAEVRKLPERQARAVALHYLEDLPIAEIAQVLECAEGTVKTHLHRRRLRLAQALGLLDGEDGGER